LLIDLLNPFNPVNPINPVKKDTWPYFDALIGCVGEASHWADHGYEALGVAVHRTGRENIRVSIKYDDKTLVSACNLISKISITNLT
jgi:hypothetical protein